jgi:hypothetical protein
MIYILKLKFPSIEDGLAYLQAKGIITENMGWGLPIHSVVNLGEGQFDLMIEGYEYDFGDYVINPLTPNHSFAGFETNNSEEPEEITNNLELEEIT